MKRWIIAIIIGLPLTVWAGNRIYDPQVKTLEAVVNGNWLSPVTIMRLGSDDVLNIGFDELSHDYHRYTYRLERCEADWKPAKDVFDSDWLEGFNGLPIDNYERSKNTTVLYTHYSLQIPNNQVQLKMSGNYRIHITDEDTDKEVAMVELLVTEASMTLALEATTNTDIDTNGTHQQLSMSLNFGNCRVTKPEDQIKTVVMQNGRQDNWRRDTKPTARIVNGLEWNHQKDLIFDGGNEYRKFEVLDPSHPTMGIDYIFFVDQRYHVYPYVDEPRPNYLYDEDANGAFHVRNSDNRENETTCDYVYINFCLTTPERMGGDVIIDGAWTTEEPNTYIMEYDEGAEGYWKRILLKQGYYSYQYLFKPVISKRSFLSTEGNFYQTENTYQALVYYKGIDDRSWRLTAYSGIQLASSDTHDRTLQ